MDGTGELFAPLLEALPGVKTTVVTYPRGHCLGWEELVQIVEDSIPNEEPVMLVAESFSGPVAIKLASRKSRDIKALVLCCSFASNPLPRWLGFLPLPRLAFQMMPRFAIRRFLAGPASSDDLVEAIRKCVKSVSPRVLANRARMIRQVDVRMEWKAMDIPLLCLSGRQDRILSSRVADEMESLQPDASYVTLDGPHLLLQCAPRIAAAEIRKFSRATEKRPPHDGSLKA